VAVGSEKAEVNMRITALNYLDEPQRQQVAETIAEAEEQTAADILCAVATESGRYDRAESLIGLLVALLLLGVANITHAQLALPAGDWGVPSRLPFAVQAAAVVLGFLVGLFIASHWHGLRRLFVSQAEMDEETARAASHVFSDLRLGLTRQRGGLLVYVTLFEREVVILADRIATQAIDQSTLAKLRDIAVAKLKVGRRLEAMVDTVQAAADSLRQNLPADENEGSVLPDQLICIHPRP
jgi:putative membrane protein